VHGFLGLIVCRRERKEDGFLGSPITMFQFNNVKKKSQ
jgi:hypothetical protein